ncbi:Sugar kinase, ribokinase family [Halapricum desulfuricans]|uniref:Sugar kinase, ribokinase family n=1 Tax=Halapricum desulfuricans TaxID=2841257 RepID=A0A897NKG8_9EURY|nr:carbohydrate kinase [Halapricum desulfuricans]QSG13232.1 Sugar kinase, ribokinase family [Halapricum desulfuricans]
MDDPQVLVAGEALIDLFPATPGPIADAETLTRRAGGAPTNVAVALARLGHPPLLWARLGDDPFGDHLADVLTDNGVREELLERDPERKTAHTLVGEDEDGDQSFTFFADETATFAMQPGAVPAETLERVEWVHVGGVTLHTEPSRSATLELMERASERGCTVSFDPNTRADLWPEASVLVETLERALGLADVVKTDRDDLSVLVDAADEDALAADLLERGPHTVLLTRGSEGAMARASEAAPWGPAETAFGGFEVDVVETTGAGDAFVAGTIAGLLGERSLSETVRYASAVGALATTATGAMDGLPSEDDVAEIIADNA